jgi:hypothetical protein
MAAYPVIVVEVALSVFTFVKSSLHVYVVYGPHTNSCVAPFAFGGPLAAALARDLFAQSSLVARQSVFVMSTNSIAPLCRLMVLEKVSQVCKTVGWGIHTPRVYREPPLYHLL